MTGSFRLDDAMPLLEDILKAEKGVLPKQMPHKPNKFFCDKCRLYHFIYSEIGNDHRDYKE